MTLLAAAIALLSCRTGDPPAPVTRPVVKASPADLPDVARELLTDRMHGHADQMALLFWSVLFLDDIGIAQLADAISREPKLARPAAPNEDTLNAMLPEQFFILQDELAVKAKALIEVVNEEGHDATAIGRAYGELATTCVKCHEQYMYNTSSANASVR